MTDADPQTAAESAPAQPGAEPAAEAPARGERVGTILMAVALAGITVLVLDVALKGKLLAPLFALLPAPKSSTLPEAPDDAASAPGD
jgi:hypothetical protein